MAYIGEGFDPGTINPEAFTPAPPGRYNLVVANSEMKKVKDKPANQFLEVEFRIVDGPFKDKKIWDRFNLKNTNAVAVDIAEKGLTRLSLACGITQKWNDSAVLHGNVFQAEVIVEMDNKNRPMNHIGEYIYDKSLAAVNSSTTAAGPAANKPDPIASNGNSAPWANG